MFIKGTHSMRKYKKVKMQTYSIIHSCDLLAMKRNKSCNLINYFKIARRSIKNPLPSFSANFKFFSAFLKSGLIFNA